jgi:hypothetical protein
LRTVSPVAFSSRAARSAKASIPIGEDYLDEHLAGTWCGGVEFDEFQDIGRAPMAVVWSLRMPAIRVG